MPERRPIDDCVHCGFCLPVCPTYVAWGEEMDSPRGRIDLARAVADGAVAFDGAVVSHFDLCLGCMACLPACPSGVRYDLIVQEARARIEREHPRRPLDRLRRGVVFALFPYPARLKVMAALLWLYAKSGLQWLVRKTGLLRLLSPWLAQLDGLAPEVTLHHLSATLPPFTPARGPSRLRVGLVAGCVQKVFFPGVNEATIRVLSAEGCEVVVPGGQGCCGALSVHAGREDEARRMTRALIERFEAAGVEHVVLNAAGCGSHLKDCRALFAGDAFADRAAAFSAKVKDVTELLASLAPLAERHRIEARVAYHSPCHLGHAQGIVEQPRKLLRAIPGLELCEIPESEHCCGSAGVYNLVEVQAANEIGTRKVQNVLSTKAGLVASANPGCTIHMQRLLRERGLSIQAAHPIEILDASIRGDAGAFPATPPAPGGERRS
jgi:glycolate oxidase iron-sulfur subunit